MFSFKSINDLCSVDVSAAQMCWMTNLAIWSLLWEGAKQCRRILTFSTQARKECKKKKKVTRGKMRKGSSDDVSCSNSIEIRTLCWCAAEANGYGLGHKGTQAIVTLQMDGKQEGEEEKVEGTETEQSWQNEEWMQATEQQKVRMSKILEGFQLYLLFSQQSMTATDCRGRRDNRHRIQKERRESETGAASES